MSLQKQQIMDLKVKTITSKRYSAASDDENLCRVRLKIDLFLRKHNIPDSDSYYKCRFQKSRVCADIFIRIPDCPYK